MTDSIFLTLEEVVERYSGQISAGTFRNWRSTRIGTSFARDLQAFEVTTY